ncbi:MATE family efflux transporter [Caldithrix abyssi]
MKNDFQPIIYRNIHGSIFRLSLPGMISSVLETLFQLIDAYWVGRLGADALAAIGGCAFVLWAIFSLTALSVNGIAALVAQNIGAQKAEEGRVAAGQGLILNTLTVIFAGGLVYLLQNDLYRLMGFDARVLSLARQYMSIILSGMIFIFWFTAFEAVFRGLGDTKTPMIVLAFGLTLNAIADPFFIFGWWIFPEMGIGGAAFATVVSELAAVVGLWWLLKRKHYLPTFNRRLIIDRALMKKLMAIGAPVAFGGFFFSIIYVVLTRIIAQFGMEAIAAIGIGHRIEGIAWFACVGFSVAASTLVGQNVGAGRIKQAAKAAWLVNGYGVAILLIVSAIYYFFPDVLMGVFTQDPLVQKIGTDYLRIIALFEIFLALEVIMEGAFSGAGYTLPVMLVSVPITAARIPLAYLLAVNMGLGTNGIWWAIAITTGLKGFLNAALFATGIWKRKLQREVNHEIEQNR